MALKSDTICCILLQNVHLRKQNFDLFVMRKILDNRKFSDLTVFNILDIEICTF